jgi:deazaflavin-dependent oxidoreductase (nitroreductase family)
VNVKPPPALIVKLNSAVLRLGLHVGSQHLLTVPGRKSGLPRSTPVSIATVGDDRYIVAAFPSAAWVGNVRVARGGTLMRGDLTEYVKLVEVPVEERGPILRAFLEQVRGGVRFFGPQTTEQVVARADRYPVFRVAT